MNAAEPRRGREAGGESHVYDGIIELDNKLPLWWQLTLYGAVLFALVYWFGRRLNAIDTPGQLYAREVAAQRLRDAELARERGTIDDTMLATLAKDPETVAKGRETFALTCAPCHRVDGGGNIGPNLTDKYWLHGGRPTDVFRTISDGVPAKGMPTWGPQLGQDRTISAAAFVVSIANTNVAGGKAPQGEPAR